MQVQARHQLHAMILNGLRADFENLPDLLGVLPLGDELENFRAAGSSIVRADAFWSSVPDTGKSLCSRAENIRRSCLPD